MSAIKIINRGRYIESTNYFETEFGYGGVVAVSVNDNTFRLLIPWRLRHGATDVDTVADMTKGVKFVIASRGIVQGVKAITFVFEDGTDDPYMLTSDYGAFVGFAPAESDHGREDLSCLGYVYDPAGGIKEVFDLPCKFRWSDGKPDLSEWRG